MDKKYYFVEEALTLPEKGYKEYAMYIGKHYARARLVNDTYLSELYFADDIISNLQIVGITKNKADYYTVSPKDDWKITREDGMSYVYVENGLMREQDKRLYRPVKIDPKNLPCLIYKVYEELWNATCLEEYRTNFDMCIRDISVKPVQDLIEKINASGYNERMLAKNKIVRLLCQDPPMR